MAESINAVNARYLKTLEWYHKLVPRIDKALESRNLSDLSAAYLRNHKRHAESVLNEVIEEIARLEAGYRQERELRKEEALRD